MCFTDFIVFLRVRWGLTEFFTSLLKRLISTRTSSGAHSSGFRGTPPRCDAHTRLPARMVLPRWTPSTLPLRWKPAQTNSSALKTPPSHVCHAGNARAHHRPEIIRTTSLCGSKGAHLRHAHAAVFGNVLRRQQPFFEHVEHSGNAPFDLALWPRPLASPFARPSARPSATALSLQSLKFSSSMGCSFPSMGIPSRLHVSPTSNM